MARYADFSGRPPGAAALKAAGFVGVLRYAGPGSEGKQIHRAEWQDYLDHALDVILIAELGIDDAWAALNDYQTGQARAQLLLADARAEAPLGVNVNRVRMACAADAHASSAAQISDAVAYSRGFASVVGLWRSGFYGFAETSRAVHSAGAAGWHWRCGSKPSLEDQKWVNFWQRNDGTITVAGTVCDINETYAPLEADVQLDDTIPNWTGGEAVTVRDVLAKVYRDHAIQLPSSDRPHPSDTDDMLGKILNVDGRLRHVEAKLDQLLARPAADIDEAALAAELAARGVAGVTAAQLIEILSSVRLAPTSSSGGS